MMSEAKKFIPKAVNKVMVIGCGGTGSYLVQGLAKMIHGYGLDISVTLVDPDIVEEKNVSRQNFSPDEVGWTKAESLAFRMSERYGVRFRAVVDRCENVRMPHDYLAVTCVDRIAPRKMFQNAPLWLDLGNGESQGQAIFGTTSRKEKIKEALEKWDKSPFVSDLPNAFLKVGMSSLKDRKSKRNVSCAEMVFSEQGCFVNEESAQAGLNILHQVLVCGEVSVPATYFDFRKARKIPASITKEYLDI